MTVASSLSGSLAASSCCFFSDAIRSAIKSLVICTRSFSGISAAFSFASLSHFIRSETSSLDRMTGSPCCCGAFCFSFAFLSHAMRSLIRPLLRTTGSSGSLVVVCCFSVSFLSHAMRSLIRLLLRLTGSSGSLVVVCCFSVSFLSHSMRSLIRSLLRLTGSSGSLVVVCCFSVSFLSHAMRSLTRSLLRLTGSSGSFVAVCCFSVSFLSRAMRSLTRSLLRLTGSSGSLGSSLGSVSHDMRLATKFPRLGGVLSEAGLLSSVSFCWFSSHFIRSEINPDDFFWGKFLVASSLLLSSSLLKAPWSHAILSLTLPPPSLAMVE